MDRERVRLDPVVDFPPNKELVDSNREAFYTGLDAMSMQSNIKMHRVLQQAREVQTKRRLRLTSFAFFLSILGVMMLMVTNAYPVAWISSTGLVLVGIGIGIGIADTVVWKRF